jgi:import inner membrane translocase subunit TIM23
MTLWDSLTGKRPSSSRHDDASPTSSDLLSDSAASAQASSSNPLSQYQVQDVSSLLSGTSTSDPASLHPLAGLNSNSIDYLTLDESTLSDLPGAQSALPSRGWSDDLCYGTGITYVSALGLGGVWGLAEGLQRTPATTPPRLRLNAVLNSVTRRGPFMGNSAGVIALVYNVTNSFIGHMRGKHDAGNSVVAGALSGALFKSSRGLRPTMISSGLVASAAGLWAVS